MTGKRVVMLLIIALLSVPSAALAHSDKGSSIQDKPMPLPGVTAPADPDYKPKFKSNVKSEVHTGSGLKDEIGIQSYNPTPHTHQFLGIYNTYDGTDPVEVLTDSVYSCVPQPGLNSCTLGYSQIKSWAHKFGVNVAFEVAKVRLGVGYDVTYSSATSVTFSANYAPGYKAKILRQQWYHVQEYNVKNTWIWSSLPYNATVEYGTGWAAQWFQNHVYPLIYQ